MSFVSDLSRLYKRNIWYPVLRISGLSLFLLFLLISSIFTLYHAPPYFLGITVFFTIVWILFWTVLLSINILLFVKAMRYKTKKELERLRIEYDDEDEE